MHLEIYMCDHVCVCMFECRCLKNGIVLLACVHLFFNCLTWEQTVPEMQVTSFKKSVSIYKEI